MPSDARLREAFAAIDRTGFLTERERPFADEDRPLGIGHGQTNSQPSTVAAMLELLDVQQGQHVLDVGAGSGWTTALLGHLVGPTGRVIGLEVVPELARWGAENVGRHAMPWATLQEPETGTLGAPDQGPFDRILVSAEGNRIPAELIDQLAEDGLMVIPVQGRMSRVRRHADGSAQVTHHGWYRFVPLVGGG